MRVLSICAAALLAAAALTPDASAQRRNNQAATTVVVNYQRVLAESAVGRDINGKLQQVGAQISAEMQALSPERDAIEAERTRLAQATRNLTPQQIQGHATYGPQFQALAQRLQQFQTRGQGLQGDMECTRIFALREFDQHVSPILRSVMEARGAGVILDAAGVSYFAPEYDITNTVIQQLDQAVRTGNVARRGVAECQAAAPAAPAAQ